MACSVSHSHVRRTRILFAGFLTERGTSTGQSQSRSTRLFVTRERLSQFPRCSLPPNMTSQTNKMDEYSRVGRCTFTLGMHDNKARHFCISGSSMGLLYSLPPFAPLGIHMRE